MNPNIAATIMRIVLGIIFLAHGIAKFQTGLGNTSGWFASMGLPYFLGYLVAYLELLGGIALIAGLFARVAAAALALVLLGAIFSVKLSAGLLGGGEAAGYELDLALLSMCLYFLLSDAVGFGLDSFLKGWRNKTAA